MCPNTQPESGFVHQAWVEGPMTFECLAVVRPCGSPESDFETHRDPRLALPTNLIFVTNSFRRFIQSILRI